MNNAAMLHKNGGVEMLPILNTGKLDLASELAEQLNINEVIVTLHPAVFLGFAFEVVHVNHQVFAVKLYLAGFQRKQVV